jgi:hypothetical protein
MTRRPAKTFVTAALLAGAALLSTTDARAEPRRGESSTWLRVDDIWSQQDGRGRKRMTKAQAVPEIARSLRGQDSVRRRKPGSTAIESLKVQHEGF